MDRFEGNKIVIRKAKMSDLKAIHKNIYSDEVLLSTMFLNVTKTLNESKERLIRTIEFQKDKDLFFVALKDNDEVIGLCGFKKESDDVYSEAGLAIAREYQGQGFATEVLNIILTYCFVIQGAKEFAYYSMDNNYSSIALANKFGFKYDSCNIETRNYDQKEFLINRYILTKDKYFENH